MPARRAVPAEPPRDARPTGPRALHATAVSTRHDRTMDRTGLRTAEEHDCSA